MRIVAGIEIDPSTGPAADASIGEAWVRPGGLLQILETQLGLLAPRATQAERVAWLYGRLRGTDGFWSASFEADPWGTAARLVRDRDALAAEGWTGQPVSPRWDSLWSVTEGIPPGPPDRWAAVLRVLPTRSIEIESIRQLDPENEWPGAVRKVFEALRGIGVTITEAVPESAPAVGDLAAARRGSFEASADGSLQLVRPQGPVQAAEDVAAYLAALRETAPEAGMLVVTPDATLDAALHRAGLPTTGATATSAGGALQVLPLALQLVWDPPDPQVALQLLALPRTPIPRRLASKLMGALRQWPAVGSEDWVTTLSEYVYGDEPEAAERRRARTEVLLTPSIQRGVDSIPVAELLKRIEVVAAWARALAQSPSGTEPDSGRWRRAALQHRTLLRLLEAVGTPNVSAPVLARLVDAATQAASTASPYPPQAGLPRVSAPGAVLRPVETIVWWNFTRDVAPSIHDLGLTQAERGRLAEAGVVLPTAGDRAMGIARRWRRPLQMATGQLLLVAPRSAAPGELLHPHPLWDEVVASIPKDKRDAMAASMIVPRPGLGARPPASRTPAQALPLPAYRDRWDVPAGALGPREEESPSALGTLVGCSFRWALHYPLRIRDDRSSYRLSDGPREYGSLAHEVLAKVLADPDTFDDPDPAAVQQRASAVFEAIGPRRVAPLFLPGRDGKREEIRLTIMRSASAVVQWLTTYGLRPDKVEESLQGSFESGVVKGQVDLLARSVDGGSSVVVDFKWGRRDARRREIEAGTAYQLATYAYAAAQGGPMPEYAYFILYHQLMVGRAGGPFDPNTTVEGPPPSETWAAFARTCRDRLAEVAGGVVVSPGGLDDLPDEPIRVGDQLVLPPPCEWCSHDVLCGIAFMPEEDA